jgi:hypothetical protein
MPTFDPSAKPDTSGGGGSDERVETNDNIPSGDYLLRAVWFDSQFGKQSKKEYLRIKWEILAGEFAGTGFFGNLSCSVDVGPVAARWRDMCRALGISESFEIGGQAGVRDFARLFKNKPFRARVNRSESGDYVNYDISKTYGPDTWSDNERAAVGGGGGTDEPAPDSDDVPF